MPFFKFYRPNVYFDKAIRYNELYFCENKELNDPNDLKVSYYFQDDVHLWRELLSLEPTIATWNLGIFLDKRDAKLASKLNEVFKGVEFDSTIGSIRSEVEKRSPQVIEIFKDFIRPERKAPENLDLWKGASLEDMAKWCQLSLIALLNRATNHKFYSVSFSKSALNPMMWAHYADGFKGCAVIYGDLGQKQLALWQNIASPDRLLFDFLEVKYIDEQKKVPILDCAIGGQAKAQNVFLKKNSFWSYESEYRLLSSEKLDASLLAMGEVKKKNNRERILHHDTNTIIGIIFGPRCDPQFKEKTELALRDNRYFGGRQPFYSLDTKLTHEGNVIISAAHKCLCHDQREMRQILDEQQLTSLLLELQIGSD